MDSGVAGGRYLFVSPHLDDAVLSAGGLLARRATEGGASAVLTVFAGIPSVPFPDFAAAFHDACGLGADAVAIRRAEDRAALETVRTTAWHGDFLDAIYRRGPDGEPLYDGEGRIFGVPAPADQRLCGRLREAVRAVVGRFAPTLMLGPLAAGNHVDHVLTRQVVEAVGLECGVPVWLWEDQPYSVRHRPAGTGRAVSVTVPADAWRRRERAVLCYRSQLRVLAPDEAGLPAALRRYSRSLGTGSALYERYWQA